MDKWGGGGRKYWLQALLLLGLSVAWSVQSIQTMTYRNGMLKAYHDELLRAAPMDPEHYRGIVLLSDPSTLKAATRAIERNLDLSIENTNGIRVGAWGRNLQWVAVAKAAGFHDARACFPGAGKWASSRVCREVIARFPPAGKEADAHDAGSGLYRFPGTHDGYLVVSVNSSPNLSPLPRRTGRQDRRRSRAMRARKSSSLSQAVAAATSSASGEPADRAVRANGGSAGAAGGAPGGGPPRAVRAGDGSRDDV